MPGPAPRARAGVALLGIRAAVADRGSADRRRLGAAVARDVAAVRVHAAATRARGPPREDVCGASPAEASCLDAEGWREMVDSVDARFRSRLTDR